HHVENPREVVSQGDVVNVKIIEVDAERRRLSLSLKRVEPGAVPLPRADGSESLHATAANLDLSEDVFGDDAPSDVAYDDGFAPEPEAQAEHPGIAEELHSVTHVAEEESTPAEEEQTSEGLASFADEPAALADE